MKKIVIWIVALICFECMACGEGRISFPYNLTGKETNVEEVMSTMEESIGIKPTEMEDDGIDVKLVYDLDDRKKSIEEYGYLLNRIDIAISNNTSLYYVDLVYTFNRLDIMDDIYKINDIYNELVSLCGEPSSNKRQIFDKANFEFYDLAATDTELFKSPLKFRNYLKGIKDYGKNISVTDMIFWSDSQINSASIEIEWLGKDDYQVVFEITIYNSTIKKMY